ncbi:MAG TPA: hypothetical protein ENI78_02440 [Euryarchaeota archaeon]|nr:hypothetical protein [Euryarchaeota archaeon]
MKVKRHSINLEKLLWKYGESKSGGRYMQEILERIIVDFVKNSGVIAASIMDADGLLIVSHAPNISEDEQEASAGLMSQLLITAREVSSAAGFGEVQNLMTEAEKGKLFVMNASDVYFGFFTEPNVSLGYIRVQAKRTVDKIKSSI